VTRSSICCRRVAELIRGVGAAARADLERHAVLPLAARCSPALRSKGVIPPTMCAAVAGRAPCAALARQPAPSRPRRTPSTIGGHRPIPPAASTYLPRRRVADRGPCGGRRNVVKPATAPSSASPSATTVPRGSWASSFHCARPTAAPALPPRASTFLFAPYYHPGDESGWRPIRQAMRCAQVFNILGSADQSAAPEISAHGWRSTTTCPRRSSWPTHSRVMNVERAFVVSRREAWDEPT